MQLAAIARFARTAFALPAVRAAILPLVLTAGLAATTGARSQADITDVRISDSLYRQWMERTGGRPIKPGYTGDASYDRVLRDIDRRLADMDRGGLGYPGGAPALPRTAPRAEPFPLNFPAVGTGNPTLDREYRIGRFAPGASAAPAARPLPAQAGSQLRASVVLLGLANVAANNARTAAAAGMSLETQVWNRWAAHFHAAASNVPTQLPARDMILQNIQGWRSLGAAARSRGQESAARFAAAYSAFWADLDAQLSRGVPGVAVRFPAEMSRTAP